VAIKSQKDFFSGLLFVIVGVAFAIGARTYTVGTGARMGPGYFPTILGVILALLGAVIVFGALRKGGPDGDKIGKWAWRPLFFIILSNLVFGVLLGGLPSIGLPAMGLIAAIYALVIISSMAGDQFEWKGVIILATILAVGSYIAFVWGLKLQFQVWPSFISG